MPIMDEETQRGRVWKLSRSDKGLHKIPITASELISLSMEPRFDVAAGGHAVLDRD